MKSRMKKYKVSKPKKAPGMKGPSASVKARMMTGGKSRSAIRKARIANRLAKAKRDGIV